MTVGSNDAVRTDVVSEGVVNIGLATEPGLCDDHRVRRGEAIHLIFYTAGALCLVFGVFVVDQLAIIAIALLLIGAGFHLRWHRRDVTPAYASTESMDSRIVSRPGLHDRYEGIMTSLTRRDD